jgi:hypothetical protein
MQDRKTFLLVEEQALVQLDMAQGLLELFPSAVIVEARGAEQAMSALDGVERLTGAISGVGFESTRNSALGTRVAALGGWLICLHGRHADRIVAEGWHPLAQPFAEDDLQNLVRTLTFDEAHSHVAC